MTDEAGDGDKSQIVPCMKSVEAALRGGEVASSLLGSAGTATV